MDRRSFLARLGGTALALTAGCASGRSGGSDHPDSGGTSGTFTPGVQSELDLPVPTSDLRRGALKDAIPAIIDPAFAPDWSGLSIEFKSPGAAHTEGTIEPRLRPDDFVVGVADAGRARAYPLRILNWHEAVNDAFGGPLLVTFCPLCGSAVTADRTVGGAARRFGVSGYLWNSNLVLYDAESESYWSQLRALAIRGPETGERLTLRPSQLTTWSDWRQSHPDTVVLLPPPHSNTVRGPVALDYTTNPYRRYERNGRIGINQNPVPERAVDLHPKTQVLGITANGAAKAYPLDRVAEAGVVNDRVGDVPVVVTTTAAERSLVAYVRRVDGTTVRFERPSGPHLRATESGTRWAVATGRPADGSGSTPALEPATSQPQLFWFAWLDFHPETAVYEG